MLGSTVTELSPRTAQRSPRVSVVIPTYNEAKNLPHVFELLPDGLHEVIVVDGHSVDDTIEVARALRPDVVVVRQNRIGKGNAMACGFAAVTGDIVVMLDADGSADPREIERYVAALVDGADFAKGSRFAPGGGSADITRVRAWGNRWLNRIANALFGTRYTDLCYGYNAFWAHCLPALELDAGGHGGSQSSAEKLWGDGFEIETLINTRIAKAGLSITEVPSYEAERIHGQSNLNTWRDGFRVLRALLVERFNRKGHDVEIVRTEPRDVAPVIPLPVRMHGNRVIHPLDVPAGTVLRETVFVDNVAYDPESYDPGPLARALMDAHAAEGH
jgi:glycosyltransferase involved in cell wall biosynthesis